MQKTAPGYRKTVPSPKPENDQLIAALSTAEVERLARLWLLEGKAQRQSPRTLTEKQGVLNKLLWFLGERNYTTCDRSELMDFLAYCSDGHNEPGGRWGNPRMTRPISARTLWNYSMYLRAFFAWIVADDRLAESPFLRIKKPIVRAHQVRPFSEENIAALFDAARRSKNPKRDLAIIKFAVDTGVRASELCGLQMNDLDLGTQCCTVLGKGGKRRTIYFGRDTTKALCQYLKEQPRDDEDFLFLSDRGAGAGDALTRAGLLQMFGRLGKAGRIVGVRVSPHTARHTFAVRFLQAGGNVFTLQRLLGHETLAMTNRYLSLTDADLEDQHRQFSPVDQLKRKGRVR